MQGLTLGHLELERVLRLAQNGLEKLSKTSRSLGKLSGMQAVQLMLGNAQAVSKKLSKLWEMLGMVQVTLHA